MRHQKGFSLVEALLAVALLAMAALIGVPALLSASAQLRVEMAAYELVGALHETRSLALRYSVQVGLKLYPEPGRIGFAQFRDGDGDGVRSADIRSGVDPRLSPTRWFRHLGGRTGFGFPPGPPPRDPGSPSRRLGRREDPVRFTDADIASFGPMGTSNSGSLYVTDGRDHLMVVRLQGRMGKVRVLRWDADEDRWR